MPERGKKAQQGPAQRESRPRRGPAKKSPSLHESIYGWGKNAKRLEDHAAAKDKEIDSAVKDRRKRTYAWAQKFKLDFAKEVERAVIPRVGEGTKLINRKKLDNICAKYSQLIEESIKRTQNEKIGDVAQREARSAAIAILQRVQAWTDDFSTSIKETTRPLLMSREDKRRLKEIIGEARRDAKGKAGPN